jgi:thiosulfate/3-mercaptopyruvate sulfurtransferase
MALVNSISQNLITSKNLKKILGYKKIRIIDCRWYLEDKKKGYFQYKKNHIPGAIFFNIDKISNKESELPHMFPKTDTFIEFVNKFGINKNSEIIIYDQIGFFSSSRVWLLFKYFGFKKVKILDGGFYIWLQNKYQLENSQKKSRYSRCYSQISMPNLIINKLSLKKEVNTNKSIIIDARPVARFKGEVEEPRPNLKKGNIKNSVNTFFGLITNNHGYLKKKDELIKIFDRFSKKKDIICYCGSGITACNIIFVLYILNFRKIKLYDGSWAEWGKIK